MKKIIILVLIVLCQIKIDGQKDLNNRNGYINNELSEAKDDALSNLDTTQLKFALWSNPYFDRRLLNKLKEIELLPTLNIADNCFVAINCDYYNDNISYCIENVKDSFVVSFLKFENNKWFYFSYDKNDPLKSSISEDYYMVADIFKIKDFSKHFSKPLFVLNRNICFYRNGLLYTFLKAEPILLSEYYNSWNAHKFHFINNCNVLLD